MLTSTSLLRATSAGVAQAVAPCSDAQRAALPAVCVHTLSGKPARARFAAMREPMMPRPRNPIRSEGRATSSDMPASSPTRRFHAKPLAGAHRAGELPGERPPVELIVSATPWLTPLGPAGCVAAALGDQREGHLLERFDLSYDAVAPAVGARASRAPAQRIRAHAQREFALERLDGRVERVAHRDVYAAGPVRVGARSLAAAERLVVGEARVPECQVVHRALAQRAAECAE